MLKAAPSSGSSGCNSRTFTSCSYSTISTSALFSDLFGLRTQSVARLDSWCASDFSTSTGGAGEKEKIIKYPKAKDIFIPLDKVSFAYARSSGPGGQNVNKLNTKAELRFNVEEASDAVGGWIPRDVVQRLSELQAKKINAAGELVITSQESRTQKANKDDCVSKLQIMLEEAYVEPKDRHIWTGISGQTKNDRKEHKRHRASIKSSRGGSHKDYD
jgi:protein subunit release factor B